ncbi:MAG TPA: cbb3-type cytochrome c oxidase subunit 3 [Ramlibacter sp.]|jgi:cytochrome c oxidase cbb3-type subunit 4|nr:cbb3-type cytochrome c oxidase subunit 3 [Ramlibacter sp.]
MDINILREIATVLSFATFIGIVGWAWSRRNRDGFEEAGRIPFQQDE